MDTRRARRVPIEDETVHTERGRAAHDGTDVGRIVDVLQHDDVPRVIDQPSKVFEWWAFEQCDDVEGHAQSGEHAPGFGARRVHRNVGGEPVEHRGRTLRVGQRGAGNAAGGESPLDHEITLGYEQTRFDILGWVAFGGASRDSSGTEFTFAEAELLEPRVVG